MNTVGSDMRQRRRHRAGETWRSIAIRRDVLKKVVPETAEDGGSPYVFVSGKPQ
jgi:hypothetical protein